SVIVADPQEPKTSIGDDFRAALQGSVEEPEDRTAVNDDVTQEEVEGESGGEAGEEFGAGVLEGGGGEVTPPEVPEEKPWYSELSELGFEGVEDEESARTRLLAAYRDAEEAR